MLSGYDYWYTQWMYVWLLIPPFVLSLWAQHRVKSTFKRYTQVSASSGLTAAEAASRIVRHNNLGAIRIERVPGLLTDHFDPRVGVLALSDSTYESRSIAAIGVAAHEAGHAMQHASGYWPNTVRSWLVPVARFGSQTGMYFAVIGLVIGASIGAFIFTIGLVAFFVAVLFYLITLPVEIDASRRAVVTLEDMQLLTGDELKGAQAVLRAAALTYIASALMGVMSFVRLLLMARNRRT